MPLNALMDISQQFDQDLLSLRSVVQRFAAHSMAGACAVKDLTTKCGQMDNTSD